MHIVKSGTVHADAAWQARNRKICLPIGIGQAHLRFDALQLVGLEDRKNPICVSF